MKKQFLSPRLLLTLAIIILGSGFLYFTQSNISQQNQTTQNSSLKKINVGRPIDPGRSLPVLIAEQKGIFSKNGLDVKSTVFNKGIDAAIISGQLDVINDAPVTFLAAAVKGADLKLVGVTMQADPYYIVSNTSKENIRRVAVNRLGGQDYYQTINSLRFLGVDMSKVEFIISGELSAKYPMLLRNSVDTAGYQPTADYFKIKDGLAKDGLKVILNRTDNPNARYPIGIITRGDYLKSNGDEIKKFILSMKEAISYARENKTDSIDILMREYQLKENEAALVYENFIAGSKNPDMKPNINDLKILLTDMTIELKEASAYNPANFVDTSYLPN